MTRGRPRYEAEDEEEEAEEGWQLFNCSDTPRLTARLSLSIRLNLPAMLCTQVVSLDLVCHELPPSAARDILHEAFRLLKPGGQLWLNEMDFDTAG